ncbi:sensor histidine kinase [Siminovitchia sp. FSL H7-0308]|uniref:Heme sensor protein HssS n=1 Tax=Siminovitchia thermophila TaxID=1245522 RepID=A0ABS2R9Q4_9BACI|nr:HAMP domain-containing sensor histidine kinase [Siminovitchia thermophila]MBM7716120.1 signal transduction histidine kinase [Siminovitchia thermophila]ONK22430.1 sensor histidine kinase [Bacillus sp. VT-16-64]
MKSLYSKFLIFTLVIMLTSALVAFLAVNTFYHQTLKAANDEKNMEIVKSFVSYVESTKENDLKQFLQTQADAGYKLIAINEKREKETYGTPFRVDNLSPQNIDRVLKGEDYHGMKHFPTETFMTGFFADESANTVGTSFTYNGMNYALFLRPDIKFLFTEVHFLLAGMIVTMAILSLLAMLFMAKKLIEPIVKLTEATKRVGEEKFTDPLQIDRKDEIGQLAQSFQLMTERLGENDRIRKEFINNVSHDFQTPLLNIKGYANLIENDPPAVERKNYAKVIQAETERLSALTKQLMLLTSLDQLLSPLQLKTFRLDEQLKETIRRYRWALEEKEMSLSLELDEIELQGDPAFLEKVWANLLSNAIKYTETGGSIEITLTEQDNTVIATFCDTGIGIPEEKIGRIFERFYRVDDSRTKEIGGSGLGLAIVRQVVELHGGNITAKRNGQQGMTFIISLPKL